MPATTLDLFNTLTADELAYSVLQTKRADLAAQLAATESAIVTAGALDLTDTVNFSGDLLANGPVFAANADGTSTFYYSTDGKVFLTIVGQPINRPIPAPTNPVVAPPPA